MNNMISFDRLKGRENFATWKLQAKSYLVVKDLWKYIEMNTVAPSDKPKDEQALAHMTLLLDPCTFSHISVRIHRKQRGQI